MKNSLAVIGIVLALMGLGLAAFQDEIRGEQSVSVQSVSQDAMDAGTKVWSGEKRFRKDGISYTYIALGLAGFTLGLAAIAKKENAGLGLAAMAIGGITAGWHFLINLVG